MAAMDEVSEARLEAKRDFAELLDSDYGRETGEGLYVKKIDEIIKKYPETKTVRLDVDVQDLADYNPNLHRRVLDHPSDCIPPFCEALEDYIRNQAPKLLEEEQRVHISFSGEFGRNTVTPRELSSEFLGKLVCLQGIITRCTLVRPKMVKSIHWCEATGAFTSREYRDATSNDGLPTSSVYPTRDEEGYLLTTQYGLCSFVDHQVVTVQELPETAPPGQLPRSVEVVLEDDLRDACKPGDRVRVVGIYKPIAPSTNSSSAVFRAILVASGVSRLSGDGSSISSSRALTETDYDNILTLSQDPALMETLTSSVAPSIYGYSWVKKALLLLLVGGRERTLANGTHLRGDVNCLLVGDPGVAKSQLLRAVMSLAPLAVSTTGRGSSGVGLTAAVTSDADTGERRLEAGAMVLADRGIVCIDEFDKMSDADRVAIHEVMEQQTVTIAKAGIMTSLNARCSVVAAANPIYGHYDRAISITRNIGLPDSLLSRFDLLFVVLDTNDPARDRQIADHVLGQHRYRAPGDDGLNGGHDRYVESLEEEGEGETNNNNMHVKYDARLYGPRVPGHPEPLSAAFLKNYIAFAKQRFAAPELTPEASDAIAEYYADLRTSPEVKALPVTVRTLETLIRLSCAHAKLRLSAFVEREDVSQVTALVDLIMKSDPSAQEATVGARARGKMNSDGAGAKDDVHGAKRTRDDDESEDDDDEMLSARSDEITTRAGRQGAANDDEGTSAAMEEEEQLIGSAPVIAVDLSSAVRAAVQELSQRSAEACNVAGVLGLLRSRDVQGATGEAVRAELAALDAGGAIMLSGEDFYLTH